MSIKSSEKIRNISTIELLKIIDDPNVQIIDIRPIDAYNGWKLKNESRGGHIKGARCLPFKWFNYIDWIEIVQSKGSKKQSQRDHTKRVAT